MNVMVKIANTSMVGLPLKLEPFQEFAVSILFRFLFWQTVWRTLTLVF